MILVDSSVVIDLLRGLPAAGQWLAQQRELLAASEITRTEVLVGMRSAERTDTERALAAYQWFPVDPMVSQRAGSLGRRYRRSHDLDVADLLIAATAEVHGLPLATGNVRHFPMLTGLRAPY